VVVVALVLALAEPKAVHAVVSALVTVSNGPGNPVPTMAVDTRNVNVVNTPVPVTGNINANVTGSVNATLTGTPSVNVSGMPAVNVASVSGNVPVTNPLDGSGNPIPLDAQGSTFGLNVFVAAQRTHIYSVASEPVSCAITASTAQTPPAEMQCVIVGHLVPAN
jgi:hypothetical protein